MIRTAAAAGVDQVLLSRDCAFAWSPKALRAGQGAHFLTSVVERVELVAWIDAFRAAGGRAYATVVADAISLYRADLRGRVAVAVGREGSGLSPLLQQACDARIAIPMAGGSESLNAAAAAAVVLFEAVRQRREDGSERREASRNR
jgi:TrmH family RNA methyltransferase